MAAKMAAKMRFIRKILYIFVTNVVFVVFLNVNSVRGCVAVIYAE